MNPDHPRWHWLTAGLLVAFLAAALYGRQRGIFWGGDDADYALLARSLLQGRYVDLFAVAQPPHTTYPPGYPALLAIWGLVMGDGLLSYTSLGILLLGGALALFANLVTLATSARTGFVAALVTVTNPQLLTAAGRVLSEAPMIFFAVLAVWLAIRKPDRSGTALAIAVAVLCALTRTAGIAVAGGLGLYWLLKRRFGAAIALGLASLVFVGSWTLWTTQAADVVEGTTYVTRFAAYDRPGMPLWRTILDLAFTKTSDIVASQIPATFGLPTTPATRLDNIAWLPIGLLSLFGAAAIGWRQPVVGLTALAYMGILFVWPFSEGRLLLPLLPLLLFGAVVGAYLLAARVRRTLAVPVATAVALLLAGAGGFASLRQLPCDRSVMSTTPDCVRPEEVALGRAIRFIEASIPDDAVVMARRGEVVHYYTRNPIVDWPSTALARSDTPSAVLERIDPAYIVVSDAYYSRADALAEVLAGTCDRLSVAFAERPHALVLQVHPAGRPPARSACDDIAGFVTATEPR